jgi:hypothetical protein
MAMITCEECRREISDQAPACPSCGAPRENATPTTSPPGYRHLGSLVAICLLLMPAALLITWTGPVYYTTKGMLKRLSIGAKSALSAAFLLTSVVWYFALNGSDTYTIRECTDDELIKTIKSAAEGSAAGKQLRFRILDVTGRHQVSWSERDQVRVCGGHAFTSTGTMEIEYTASWIDRDKGTMYVQYEQAR